MHNITSPRTDDAGIEQEIQAKGLTAPRVTPADIEAAIASEHFFTAAEGCAGHCNMAVDASGWVQPLQLLTFCVLVMKNGFTVVGKSACASPENFDAELGRKIARQDAINQCWPLLGYELRSKLAAAPISFQDRVRAEEAELNEKLTKLTAFMKTPTYAELHAEEKERLAEQSHLMRSYREVLSKRIEAFAS